MKSPALETECAFLYEGNIYSQKGWDDFTDGDIGIEPDDIYNLTNPIRTVGVGDAAKCHIYDSMIGPQLFSDSKAYDTILNVYLTVVANDLGKALKLPDNVVTPDVMNTLVHVNHPSDFKDRGDSVDVVINMLQMAKSQVALSEFYAEWSTVLKESRESKKGVSFETFCNIAEDFEDLAGNEAILMAISNINRPSNPVLLVDFVEARQRILRILDQVYFELDLQGKEYSIEDLDAETLSKIKFKDEDNQEMSLEDIISESNPENDDAWANFIKKNKNESWQGDGDDFTSGLDGSEDKYDEGDDLFPDEDFS